MATACACILICGDRRYLHAGRRAVRSVLRHSDLDVLVALGGHRLGALARRDRVQVADLGTAPVVHRSQPFLLKLRALAACLDATDAAHVLLLDADALLARDLAGSELAAALGGRGLGMVEQTGIRGSRMGRADFLAHYTRHTLGLLAPDRSAPPLERFRYFNSGVVLATRAELERLVPWALATMRRVGPRHQLGEHMVGDQDYFQLWANTLHPESCSELPWTWNHAPLWGPDGFPRTEARVLHLSNFCRGPSLWQRVKLDVVRTARRLHRARVPAHVVARPGDAPWI
jgi:hypothetical protein